MVFRLYLWFIYISYIYILDPLWSWSYGSWINYYLCNQCLSPLTLWVRIPFRRDVLDTTLIHVIKFAASRWFSPGIPVSSTNKTDHHDITVILLKVALNTISLCYMDLFIIVIFCILQKCHLDLCHFWRWMEENWVKVWLLLDLLPKDVVSCIYSVQWQDISCKDFFPINE